MRQVMLAIVGLLLLVGCTTHGRMSAMPDVAPDEAAEIIVVRESRYLAGTSNIAITLDGVPVYGISTDEHVILRVAPGFYVVGVSPRGSWTKVPVAVRAAARERYYFAVDLGSALHPIAQLQPLSAKTGEALVAKTTLLPR